jgi:hypothetical protein
MDYSASLFPTFPLHYDVSSMDTLDREPPGNPGEYASCHPLLSSPQPMLTHLALLPSSCYRLSGEYKGHVSPIGPRQ